MAVMGFSNWLRAVRLVTCTAALVCLLYVLPAFAGAEPAGFPMSTAGLSLSTVTPDLDGGARRWDRNAILVVSSLVIVIEVVLIVALVRLARRRREPWRWLQSSDRLEEAILASLSAHVAILDREGTVIAVNDAWMEFGRVNGVESESSIAEGSSYTRVAAAAARNGYPGANDALSLIQTACGGGPGGQVEYRCDSLDHERWFLMTAQPLRMREGGAIVTHTDITGRKLNETALRESESRFRHMADALPVAVWMSGPDTSRNYVNKQWLQMTGRTLEEEIGAGWLEGIHPDDRPGCMEVYLEAFRARQSFCMEYRIRHYDGEYRWLMDTGMPRYDSDGAFQGYVGGCVDTTERKEGEQILRDLNRRLIVAQEDERRRIARELHDHLSQQLALLAIELQQMMISPPGSAEMLASSLEEMWRRTTEIASDVHAMSHRLHPSKLEALGLVATIRAYCRDMSRQGLLVKFSEHNVPASIPQDVSLCLFRVLEEALTNVSRHSGVAEAQLTLFGSDVDITLRIADAGKGFTRQRQRPSGLGLVSMRERLQALGGTLSITSAPGKGTVVEARVPRARASPSRQEAGALTVMPRVGRVFGRSDQTKRAVS